MAKKNTIPIRVNKETYNELKKISEKQNESMAKVTERIIKAMKGKKIKVDIRF